MYLRFQGRVPNLGTASNLGIFQLAFQLRDRPDVPVYAQNEIIRHLEWMEVHLHAPKVLEHWQSYRAICWFKPAAREPLDHIWSMKAILEDFGTVIDLIKTEQPGLVIYEDGWQVAAKPWRRAQAARFGGRG
jgi:hypothetical protein